MDNFLSLKILDKFQKIFEKLDIDYNIMRMIIKTKLILDSRRASTIANQGKKDESEHTSFIKGYLLHLIFGVFLAFIIYLIKDEMVRMIYFAGVFFFMTTMYLISDFSFVLLDTRDKNIIMTKPVDSKTVSLSKILHVLIYMFRLNIFIAGPSLIPIVMTDGLIAIPIFLLEVFLMDLFIFLVTAFIYLLILRFFDGELLRNIINLIQIALTISVTVGYQIAIRMIDFSSLENIKYNFVPLNYLNPMLWFGAPFEIIFNGGREIYLYIFTVLLIFVPLICFCIYLKLSRKMESLLMKLENEGKKKQSTHAIEIFIGKILNRDETAKQAFYFTKAVLRSDRSLKLKIYPALSSGILLPVLMIFNMGMRGSNYEASGYEYMFLYFNFLVFSVVELLQYSSVWKGFYVFVSSGFIDIRGMYKGVLQAVAVTLIIPLIIFNSAIYIVLFKEKFMLDIVILILTSMIILPITGKIYLISLPFSRSIDESNNRQSIDKFFMLIGVSAFFAVMHVLSYKIPMGIWIYMGLLIVGIPIIWSIAIPKKITA